jgi:6-phosphogluconolactonase
MQLSNRPREIDMKSPEIKILPSAEELFRAAAVEFVTRANGAIARSGRFSVALSGGSTPRSLYSLLASGAVPGVPWEKICFFWGDERHVPPDHPDSNYRMVNEAMLSKVPVPAENIFRIPAENPNAAYAASAYEDTLRTFFGVRTGDFPRFDLILLGMGPDGHTASLFPGSPALEETQRVFVANRVTKLKTERFTLTFPALNNARHVMFLVSGPDKASIVHEVLENPAANLPSQGVHPTSGSLLWMLDQSAASGLTR